MIKALLFDIDGVLINQEKLFPETLCGFDNAPQLWNEFDSGPDSKLCDRGSNDIEIEIATYLERIHWNQTAREYLDKQYEYEENYIERDILKRIRQINDSGIKCYIASNQNHDRKRFLMHAMNIKETFTQSFFSCDINYIKPECQYWEYVHNKIADDVQGIKLQEMMFFDDRKENVESAIQYGMNAKQIVNVKKLSNYINYYV